MSAVTNPKNIKTLYDDIPRDKNIGSDNLHHRANNERNNIYVNYVTMLRANIVIIIKIIA